MAFKFKEIVKGIRLRAITTEDASFQIPGAVWFNSALNRIRVRVVGAYKTLVTEDDSQTLTNKTINSASNTLIIDANAAGNSVSNLEVADLAAGVLDTDLTSVSGTDTTIPSAKATKTYADSASAAAAAGVQSNLTTHINDTVPHLVSGSQVLDSLQVNTPITGLNFSGKAAARITIVAETMITGTETFELEIARKVGSAQMSVSSTGDNVGVSFGITASGQVTYSSQFFLPLGTLKYRYIVIA